MDKANRSVEQPDDEMLPEYDFTGGMRGKHYQVYRQGHTVTIHHADGTTTVEQFGMNSDKNYNWHGDRVQGDKVMGDKIGGDKVMRDKITHYHSQDLAQAAKDIQALLAQLSADYPNDSEAIIAARAVDRVKANPTLKQRVMNALKEAGTTALEEAIDHPAVKIFVAGAKGLLDASA